jgi:hypothetical protein
MTVIFACTFPGGAAIAGDTLMHNTETNERVMNAPKVLNISQRVSVAQAGSFNGTGEVWTKLEHLPRHSATPTTIAEAIRSFATPIYQRKCGEGPAAMRYIVAGLEADGTPAIRWLEFDANNFGEVTGPCQIAALGTMSNVQEITNRALHESLKPFSNIVMLDQWCKRVVAAEATASPHAVGFPAILIVMKETTGFGKQVGPEDPPDPAYEVYWP